MARKRPSSAHRSDATRSSPRKLAVGALPRRVLARRRGIRERPLHPSPPHKPFIHRSAAPQGGVALEGDPILSKVVSNGVSPHPWGSSILDRPNDDTTPRSNHRPPTKVRRPKKERIIHGHKIPLTSQQPAHPSTAAIPTRIQHHPVRASSGHRKDKRPPCIPTPERDACVQAGPTSRTGRETHADPLETPPPHPNRPRIPTCARFT